MHYADEIVATSGFDFPALKEDVAPAELKVAKMLIDTMTSETFAPEKYHDSYRDDVMAMIEARAAGRDVQEAPAKRAPSNNVVNLMDVLQRSLEESSKRHGDEKPATTKKTASAKKTAASGAKPKRKTSAA
jgi:DNA end-binding protein Ku